MLIAQTLLAEFEVQAPVTRKFLERLPEDKLTWKPHEKSMTAGQLAYHLAIVPGGVIRAVQENPRQAPDFKFPQPTSRHEILKTFEESIATVRSALPTFDDAAMRETWRLLAGEHIIVEHVGNQHIQAEPPRVSPDPKIDGHEHKNESHEQAAERIEHRRKELIHAGQPVEHTVIEWCTGVVEGRDHPEVEILRRQIAPLAAGLSADIDLVFVDAPSLSSGDFGWWHEGLRGWERTREWAIELFSSQHFDGIDA